MNKHLQYLKNSFNKNRETTVGSVKIAGLNVYIKEPVVGNVNIDMCLNFIADRIPNQMISNVDTVVIGNFPFLQKRNAEGIFRGGTIYLTNKQESDHSFIADIVHEIAHSFEEKENIQQDQTMISEFLQKRMIMYQILSAHNLLGNTVTENDFSNINYSQKFDDYLYKQVGYEKLNNLLGGLFVSPYASTCLREYFANAFEHFFVNDMFIVKKYATSVYNKLITYLEM